MLKLANNPNLDIKCTLLPGKFVDNNPVPVLYNDVYTYWKNTWTEYFEKAGSPPGSLNIENFMRHSFLITLHSGDKIAGTLLSTLFNINALTTFDHPGVKLFPEEVLNKLADEKTGTAITGEYLSVPPDFRKDITGISLAAVMVGLKMKIFKELECKMALATTIRKAKVDEIALKYGYKEVGSYEKCGVDCIMLYNTQATLKEHSDPAIQEMVNRLWNTRSDITGLTSKKQKISKAA